MSVPKYKDICNEVTARFDAELKKEDQSSDSGRASAWLYDLIEIWFFKRNLPIDDKVWKDFDKERATDKNYDIQMVPAIEEAIFTWYNGFLLTGKAHSDFKGSEPRICLFENEIERISMVQANGEKANGENLGKQYAVRQLRQILKDKHKIENYFKDVNGIASAWQRFRQTDALTSKETVDKLADILNLSEEEKAVFLSRCYVETIPLTVPLEAALKRLKENHKDSYSILSRRTDIDFGSIFKSITTKRTVTLKTLLRIIVAYQLSPKEAKELLRTANTGFVRMKDKWLLAYIEYAFEQKEEVRAELLTRAVMEPVLAVYYQNFFPKDRG